MPPAKYHKLSLNDHEREINEENNKKRINETAERLTSKFHALLWIIAGNIFHFMVLYIIT